MHKPSAASIECLVNAVRDSRYIAIESGQLVILDSSGNPLSDKWFNKYKLKILKAITYLTDRPLLQFKFYSTGICPGKSDRLTLCFEQIIDQENVWVHFNVDICFKRSGEKNKAGDKKPRRQFVPEKGSAFVAWWDMLELEKPRYPSEFHRKMHLLKLIIFEGYSTHNEQGLRLKIKKVPRCEISYGEIKQAVNQHLAKRRTSEGGYANGTGRLHGGDSEGNTRGEGSLENQYKTYTYNENECVSKTLRIKASDYSKENKSNNNITEMSTDEWLNNYNEHEPLSN